MNERGQIRFAIRRLPAPKAPHLENLIERKTNGGTLKLFGALFTAILLIGFMAASPAFAQDQHDQAQPAQNEPKPKEAKPPKEDHPVKENKQAADQQKNQQKEQEHQAKDQQKQQQNAAKRQQDEAKHQQQDQAKHQQEEQAKQQQDQTRHAQQDQQKQAKEQQKQQQDQAKQEQKQRENEQKQQARAQQDQRRASDHDNHGHYQQASQRERIPDDKFRAHFGQDHHFRPGRPVIVDNQPRFQYSGYWFDIVDPWPAGWSYDDDCYIDYVDDGYYLFDPVHPGVRIAVTVIL
jgi:DNA polymerase III gamma/tau subunit